ncbi:ABC-three component system protein [Micromonospora arida]
MAEQLHRGERGVLDSAPSSQELSDLPPPTGSSIATVGRLALPKPPKPHQLIFFYDAYEWEEFVLEYATGLAAEYHQIKRIGGSGDRGADIAAFLTPNGFEGTWDCFQCKHYESALMPKDAYPEMFKMLRAVVEGHYTLPRRYHFMAPKKCGPTLSRLLSAPSQLRLKFLEKFDDDKPLGAGLDPSLVNQVRAKAETLDFSIFRSVELHEMFDVHQGTRYHVQRFDAPLPDRPEVGPPPISLKVEERRYIEQLLVAYAERYGLEIATPADVEVNPKISKHFSRQREAFYSAEALRVFARDSVLPGTFENLQDDVYEGVIETHFRDFDHGLDRLQAVLEAVVALSLSAKNPLVNASKNRDKRGICHQLANADRLVWCEQ